MNIGKLLEFLRKEKGEKVGFIFKERLYTYREIEEIVNRYANFFKSYGIEKGKKIGIYLLNVPEYIFSYLAIFKIGAIAVPFDHRLKIEEVYSLLNHCGAEFLITYPGKFFNPDSIKENVPSLKEILITSGDYANAVSLEEIEKFSSEYPIEKIDENSICAIFYTSGTTGMPKGVIWTYRHLDSPMETFKYFKLFEKDETFICPLPLSHNAGIVAVLLIIEGLKLVLMEFFHPVEFLHSLIKYKINFMFLVPSMFTAIMNLKEFENVKLPYLRWAAVFGAPSSPDLLEKFKRACPQAKLFSGYGLTESAAPNVLPPLERIKPGSVGIPVPWVEIKIVDDEGNEVKRGEIGEIIMKGWSITPGYYNQSELTEEVIKDGWLYTGDMGKFDKEGYLYIVGRKKEVIIVGGLNVFAPEVEGVIMNHPKVKEVAVVGVPDRLRGEAVKAVIVPKEGENLTEKEIRNFCRKNLASYKVPTIIEFREELPKTGSGKIKKQLLK